MTTEKRKVANREWNHNNRARMQEIGRKWREKHPNYSAEKSKEWHAKNPRANKAHWLKRMYGLTLEQYDEMLSKQNNLCAICNNHVDTFYRELCVDHNHNTGKVRGLLCDQCNRGIGQLKESIETLERAIAYLRKHEEGK